MKIHFHASQRKVFFMYIVRVKIFFYICFNFLKYQDKKRNLNSRCACRNWERLFPAQSALKILLVALGHGSWVGVYRHRLYIHLPMVPLSDIYILQIELSYKVSIIIYYMDLWNYREFVF